MSALRPARSCAPTWRAGPTPAAARDPGRESRGRAILPSSSAPSGRRRPALAIDRRRYEPQRVVAARPGKCRALAGSSSSAAASASRRDPASARARAPHLTHEQRYPLATPFFPGRPGSGPDRHPHDRPSVARLRAGGAGAGVLRQPACLLVSAPRSTRVNGSRIGGAGKMGEVSSPK